METRNYQSGAVASPPSAPASPSNGYPTNGDPSGPTPPTLPGDYWFYKIGEELRAVISAAGYTPDDDDLYQLAKAIQSGGLVSATAGGTADAITAAFTPAITELTNDMVLHVSGVALNTVSNPTFTPNSGVIAAATIVKGNNKALLNGDLEISAILKWNAGVGKWILLNPNYGVHPSVGYQQTSADMTASRNPGGVVYNNSSGGPKVITFFGIASTAGEKLIFTAGDIQYVAGVQAASQYVGISGVVQPGDDYSITLSSGTFSPGWTWFEMSY
jgi:hypothetical protein